jgi:hypothetical protein
MQHTGYKPCQSYIRVYNILLCKTKNMRKIAFLIALLFLSTVTVFAQYQVKGNLPGSRGPLPSGASIKQTRTGKGLSGDPDRNFTIDNSKKHLTIEVLLAGFLPVTLIAPAVQMVSLTPDPDSQKLIEVIVTALNIQKEKQSPSYITEIINSAQINETGIRNPLNYKI